jgi:tetratricopeptide (TPR) repeat protein
MSDAIKSSRMLVRLKEEILAASNRLEADAKRAQRAIYLSRLGKYEEARAELDKLNSRNTKDPHITVSICLNIAEGIFSQSKGIAHHDNDRLKRAHALSVAGSTNSHPLRAVCAAWLAQWNYEHLDMDALALHVFEAFKFFDPSFPSSKYLACLTTAQVLHFSGREDLAQTWYRRAREFAIAGHDDMTVSALMRHKAWLQMLNMRQKNLTQISTLNGSDLMALADSSVRFQKIVGDLNWQQSNTVLFAQIHSLNGDFVQALIFYKKYFEQNSKLQSNLLADQAWCHVQLNQIQEADFFAEAAVNALMNSKNRSDTNIDDVAAAHSRLAQFFFKIGNIAKHEYHEVLAIQAWSGFSVLQEKTIKLFEKLDVVDDSI